MSEVRLSWVVVVCTLATRASADSTTSAEALFDHGKQLLDAGKIDAACEAFEASIKLDPQIGAKLNLADCRERQGRVIDAYVIYEAAANEAAHTGKPGREAFARKRLENLNSKVVRFRLNVGNPQPGLVIKLVTAPSRELPLTTPMHLAEPGTIIVYANAPDHRQHRVERFANGGSEIVIDIPALEPVAKPVVPPPAVPRRDTETPPARPAVVTASASSRPRSRLPFVLVVAGSGFLVGSVGLGAYAKLRYDDAVNQAGVDKAYRYADIATIVAVAGVAYIAVGVVLGVRRRPSRIAVTPTVHHGAVALTAVGWF